jgi:voltage-gated potassium channel
VQPLRNILRLFAGVRSALRDSTVQGLLALTSTLVAVASLFYAAVEDWSLLDSTYFAVVTIATIGYGDLVPRTAAGKIFTIVYVTCGNRTSVAAAGALGERIVRRRLGK